MKNQKHLAIFGILAGLCNVFGWWIMSWFFSDEKGMIDFQKGEVIGYIAMLLSFFLIFLGIRYHKENVLEGTISFRQAFSSGLTILIFTSLIYVVGWEFYYPTVADQFNSMYEADLSRQIQEKSLSAAEADALRSEMGTWIENYKNPLIRISITLMEIFPAGLLMCLVSSLILRSKN